MQFINKWHFSSSKTYELVSVFETPPVPLYTMWLAFEWFLYADSITITVMSRTKWSRPCMSQLAHINNSRSCNVCSNLRVLPGRGSFIIDFSLIIHRQIQEWKMTHRKVGYNDNYSVIIVYQGQFSAKYSQWLRIQGFHDSKTFIWKKNASILIIHPQYFILIRPKSNYI